MEKVNDYPYPLNLLRDILRDSEKRLPEKIEDRTEKYLLHVVESLSAQQKELITLRYIKGMTYRDIGKLNSRTWQAAHKRVGTILKVFRKPDNLKQILYTGKTKDDIHTLEDLELSNRARNALLRNGINTLDKLLDYGIDNLNQIRQIGEGTYKELLDKCEVLR